MKIVAFIGGSGSGKSHRAMWVAKENNISYIIDDGLLIKGNHIIAGYSAKKENTKLASVRRALFVQSEHAKQVKMQIGFEKPSAILILGTSLNMINAIVKNLELPPISQIIRIEDVAGKEEIEKAKTIRKKEGKHVIPVPTFEIKKDFSGYLLDSLRIFGKKYKDGALFIADKSVVRPTFSYMGQYTISDQVIYAICEYETANIPTVVRINHLWMQNNPTGLIIEMEITFKYGYNLPREAVKIQQRVKEALEKYTALNVLMINITVRALSI